MVPSADVSTCSNFLFGSKFKNIVSFWENEMAVAMFMKIEGANGDTIQRLD